jgi:hypothetical protein
MNKLFESEKVTHWEAAILKTDLYRNWNDWNTGNWACDALTQTRYLDDEKNQEKNRYLGI